MTCAYGQRHRLSNEPTSITHGTPPPIRNGENPKKMNMSGAIMSIYLHWEEREPVLEELIVLPKLNFQHMFTLNYILVFFVFFFFILKANLVLVKDARLTGRAPCSLCRLLPQMCSSHAQLPAATWCREMISRVRTELADPVLHCYKGLSPLGMCSPE